MTFPTSRFILCVLAVPACFVSSRGQSSPGGSRSDLWQRLEKYEHQSVEAAQAGGANRGPGAAAAFLQRADELRDFRAADAADPKGRDARRLEALMLLYAGAYGDKAQQARCDDLVRQVRADDTLPVGPRFQVASHADHRDVLTRHFADDDQRLAKLEEIGRALLREFPTVPQAYEALLSLADCSRGKQSVRLARDLLAMNAPAAIKAGAQIILDRHALVDESLIRIFTDELGTQGAPAVGKGGPIILYAWASWNEGCLESARLIAAQAPAGATIIGVNLDTDLVQAKQTAAERKLPGTLLYDPAGPASKLARRLKLTGKDDIYIANRQGKIRTVTARLDLNAELNTANN